MYKIQKPGKKEKQSSVRHFRCNNCGCEFTADTNDYYIKIDENGWIVWCECPHCNDVVTDFHRYRDEYGEVII